MNLIWNNEAWEEYIQWQKQDKKIVEKINEIIKDIKRNGNEGIGKPEPLKHELNGYWSRRIDAGNRIVYKIEDGIIKIVQCGSHYGDK